MMKRMVAGAALALAALAGCKPSIDYDTASDEAREAYLDATSKGVYAGLKRTLVNGPGGMSMKMGERKYDVARRRIDIRVDVKFWGEQPAFNDTLRSSTVLKQVCPKEYLGTPLERNKIRIYIRYAMEGGGTMAAVLLSPTDCAPYAKA
jgi:hypothetical protein